MWTEDWNIKTVSERTSSGTVETVRAAGGFSIKKNTPSLFCCETLLEIEQNCSFIDQTAGLSAMQNSNILIRKSKRLSLKLQKVFHCAVFSVLLDPELAAGNISIAFSKGFVRIGPLLQSGA